MVIVSGDKPSVEALILEFRVDGDGILKIGKELGIGTSVLQRVFKQGPWWPAVTGRRGSSIADLGTVVGTAWSGVTIERDDGHTTSIQHNNMTQVERVPK